VVVSRQVLVDSRFSSVICAPVYSAHDGLVTQVPVGPEEGFKHPSSIHCDELVSLLKPSLSQYVGSLSARKLAELQQALLAAVGLD
jgi:mRNA interferase MazF